MRDGKIIKKSLRIRRIFALTRTLSNVILVQFVIHKRNLKTQCKKSKKKYGSLAIEASVNNKDKKIYKCMHLLYSHTHKTSCCNRVGGGVEGAMLQVSSS